MNQTQTNQTEVFARDAEGRPTQVIIGDKVVSAEYAKHQTDSDNAPSVWKDNPRSIAEQIEIAMRQSNRDQRSALNVIVSNCNFALANSDNKQLRQFAEIIRKQAEQAL